MILLIVDRCANCGKEGGACCPLLHSRSTPFIVLLNDENSIGKNIVIVSGAAIVKFVE